MSFRLLILVLAAGGVFGCGPSYSPDTYASNAAQQANKVEQGVVIGVRPVGVSAAGTVGTVTGAAAGGIAGSQVGAGPVSAFAALGGSLMGGLGGSAMEHMTADTAAFEYIIRNPNGELVSVTQKDKTPLVLGQKVLVIAGVQARVVPDYTVPPPTKTQDSGKMEPASQAAKPGDVKPADAPPGQTPAASAPPTPGPSAGGTAAAMPVDKGLSNQAGMGQPRADPAPDQPLGQSPALPPTSSDSKPAILPPADAPPPSAPPGNVPPGNAPPGNAPPGNAPPGNAPPGNAPSGIAPLGNSLPANSSPRAQSP